MKEIAEAMLKVLKQNILFLFYINPDQKYMSLPCIKTGTGNWPHVTTPGRRVQPGRHGSFGHRHAASHHGRSGRPPYLGSQVVTNVKVIIKTLTKVVFGGK
jgi:hypothetical protein